MGGCEAEREPQPALSLAYESLGGREPQPEEADIAHRFPTRKSDHFTLNGLHRDPEKILLGKCITTSMLGVSTASAMWRSPANEHSK